jgi:enoyl-CoA hydratase
MPDVIFEKRGGIAWLTIDRPERRNALSPQAMCLLADAWEDIRDDDGVRVAIVTGTGDRAFSSGADLGLLMPLLSQTRRPENEWDERIIADTGIIHRALLKHVALDKPVIAAVNGAALAGGCELVLGTDLRIAATSATFGLSEAKRGLVPAGGGMTRLPRQLPYAIAMEMLLTGEAIGADKALRLGLVNRVVAPGDVPASALSLAEAIAANGPLAVRTIKRTVLDSNGVPLDEAFRIEARSSAAIATSHDAVEGPLAFLEKRTPRFTGR